MNKNDQHECVPRNFRKRLNMKIRIKSGHYLYGLYELASCCRMHCGVLRYSDERHRIWTGSEKKYSEKQAHEINSMSGVNLGI